MGSRKHRVVGRGTMKLHLISILALWSCAEWGRVDAQNRPTMPNFPDFDSRGAQHGQPQHDAMEISDSETNWSEEECCPCKQREHGYGGGYGHKSHFGGGYGNHGYSSHYGGGYGSKGYGSPSYGGYGASYGGYHAPSYGGYHSYSKGYGGPSYGGYGGHKFGGYGGYGGHKLGGYGGYGGHKFGGYGGYGGHKFGGYGGHKFGGGYGDHESNTTASEEEH